MERLSVFNRRRQDYIMLKIREVTIGKEIEVTHKCGNCKRELVTALDIDELEITPFKGDWEIDFELPRGYVDKKEKSTRKESYDSQWA